MVSNPVILVTSAQLFQALGFQKLLLQTGRGQFQPEEFSSPSFKVECYRYKESIAEDIAHASLVISHAGTVCISILLGPNQSCQ